MNNEQLAHDLAIARMAGKQLSAEILVEEYRKNYLEFLNYLQSQTSKPAAAEIMKNPI